MKALFKVYGLLMSLAVFAGESVDRENFSKVMRHSHSCITRVSGNKVYLEPRAVCVGKSGLCVLLPSDESVPLSKLSSDGTGIYIDPPVDTFVQFICADCGKLYEEIPGDGECSRCGGDDFDYIDLMPD